MLPLLVLWFVMNNVDACMIHGYVGVYIIYGVCVCARAGARAPFTFLNKLLCKRFVAF